MAEARSKGNGKPFFLYKKKEKNQGAVNKELRKKRLYGTICVIAQIRIVFRYEKIQ